MVCELFLVQEILAPPKIGEVCVEWKRELKSATKIALLKK
jgi:hypothetical protein